MAGYGDTYMIPSVWKVKDSAFEANLGFLVNSYQVKVRRKS